MQLYCEMNKLYFYAQVVSSNRTESKPQAVKQKDLKFHSRRKKKQ